MNVWIANEVRPTTEPNEVAVCSTHAKAVEWVNERFDFECGERGWDPNKCEDEHPECFTDLWGGAIGNLEEDEGWIYWDIKRCEVL